MIDRDEYGELFETQVRGTLASAFAFSGVAPGDYWPLIRGEADITLRDIGEIGHMTGYDIIVNLSASKWRDHEADQ